MYMEDWIKKLDTFLKFNEKEILNNSGEIAAAIAKRFAEDEYKKYRKEQLQQVQSDFDKLIEQTNHIVDCTKMVKRKEK